mmetsp:Transcript_40544/g.67768  ORF Transcript_40544/g.67768 Transcript_40544/m.67768 type:complete len:89 (-) Transcript_40544:151-417(-)
MGSVFTGPHTSVCKSGAHATAPLRLQSERHSTSGNQVIPDVACPGLPCSLHLHHLHCLHAVHSNMPLPFFRSFKSMYDGHYSWPLERH